MTAHQLNETHDPQRRSWVEPDAAGDFPIQNLPFGVFRRRDGSEGWRGGVAIGKQIVDLAAAERAGLFEGKAAEAARAAAGPVLNPLLALGPAYWSALRAALSRALTDGADGGGGTGGGSEGGGSSDGGSTAERDRWRQCLVAQEAVELTVPVAIGDYTDFYTSVHHATNIGRQFRPDNPLMPNYKWVPIGYHGRASSVVVSGTAFHRPMGQTLGPGAATPEFGPCKRLDYELELGIYIGPGNELGSPIPIAEADQHLFGFCVFNDWSARDIQAWEYQPLGPFLSKNFASTVSPWIVTIEALAPFRVAFERPEGDPRPLAYLDDEDDRQRGAFDIRIRATLASAAMTRSGQAPHVLSVSSYRHAYWTPAQLVAHHTVNGCNLAPGDLLGTGTLSGPTLDQAGALIELTTGGKNAIELPGGEKRTFLEDGDTLTLSAWCERPGAVRIGFGEARATVLPARA